MEQNFQTSFIPKRPVIPAEGETSRSIGLLLVLAIFIFLTMVVASGALFFYKKALSANLEDMKNNLTLAQNRFEPSRIADLQELDKRLRAGNTVLAGHIAPSPIFQALEELTMKTVRFTNFDY